MLFNTAHLLQACIYVLHWCTMYALVLILYWCTWHRNTMITRWEDRPLDPWAQCAMWADGCALEEPAEALGAATQFTMAKAECQHHPTPLEGTPLESFENALGFGCRSPLSLFDDLSKISISEVLRESERSPQNLMSISNLSPFSWRRVGCPQCLCGEPRASLRPAVEEALLETCQTVWTSEISQCFSQCFNASGLVAASHNAPGLALTRAALSQSEGSVQKWSCNSGQ